MLCKWQELNLLSLFRSCNCFLYTFSKLLEVSDILISLSSAPFHLVWVLYNCWMCWYLSSSNNWRSLLSVVRIPFSMSARLIPSSSSLVKIICSQLNCFCPHCWKCNSYTILLHIPPLFSPALSFSEMQI